MSCVLAVDLGGTRFRAALADTSGTVIESYAIDSPSGDGSPSGRHEIDADAWWRGLQVLCDALAHAAPAAFGAIQGVAICGITRTQVFVDAHGEPIRPAITWRDTRAAAGLPAWLATVPAGHAERGQINAFHPWARIAWLTHSEPQHARRVAKVLEPKDYLNLRLTGRTASDTVSMARLAACVMPQEGGADLLAAVGADAGWLPQLLAPADIVGPVQPGLPGALSRLKGVPVMACSNDTWAAVAGLGALRPGYAYNISGTTEVFGAVGVEPVHAQGLMTVDWGHGHYQVGGPGQNGADTVAWLLPLLGMAAETGVSQAMQRLLDAPRDPQPALFLPYLQGERVPYWDANLRGAFIGLNRRHGAADLAWAVMEGVAFLNRVVLERAEAALGAPAQEIRFGGGAAANTHWCQVKADICERAVVVGRTEQPGILGAAVTAWTGLGHFPSLAAAQQSVVRVARRYEPRADRVPVYREMYAQFRAAEAALAPVSRTLASINMPIPGASGV